MAFTWNQMTAKVEELGLTRDDVLFAGSAPLVARGIIPTAGDLDLVVRGQAWAAVTARAAATRGRFGDLVVDADDRVQAFSGWHGTPASSVFDRAETIAGWKVLSLEDLIAYKRALGRAKDVEHLVALGRWATTMPDHDPPLVDRHDAGMRVAGALARTPFHSPVVLALPRGGVPVAAPVARALDAPLDVLVIRKLGLPTNPEYAFGAIGEGGVEITDTRIIQAADLTEAEIAEVVERERAELRRRHDLYRPGKPDLDLSGRTAVIVDDGVATGSTALAAIAVARGLDAARVVVATGACPPDVLQMLRREADHAVAAVTREPFLAVGQWYRDFAQITDAEVGEILAAA